MALDTLVYVAGSRLTGRSYDLARVVVTADPVTGETLGEEVEVLSVGQVLRRTWPSWLLIQAPLAPFVWWPANAHYWCISVFALFWLAFPFVAPRLRRASTRQLLAAMVVLFVLSWVTPNSMVKMAVLVGP